MNIRSRGYILKILIVGLVATTLHIIPARAGEKYSPKKEEGSITHFDFEKGEGREIEDVSSNENNAVIEGEERWSKDAKEGRGSYRLDGENFLNFGDKFGNLDEGTIEIWIKPEKEIGPGFINAPYCSLFGKSGVIHMTYRKNGKLEYGLKDREGKWHLAHSKKEKWEKNKWYHICVSWGKEGMKLFVDGELEGKNEYSGKGEFEKGRPFYLGAYSLPIDSKLTEPFSGIVDEFKVYAIQKTPVVISRSAPLMLVPAFQKIKVSGEKIPYAKEEKERIICGNEVLEFIFDKNEGVISSFAIKKRESMGIDLLAGSPAYLIITDKSSDKRYDTKRKIEKLQIERKNNIIYLRIKKDFSDAPFDLEEDLTITNDNLRWGVSLKNKGGIAREIWVTYVFPAYKSGAWFWVADDKSPQMEKKYDYGTTLSEYGGSLIMIPAISIFNPGEDFGLGVVSPFEIARPRFGISLNKEDVEKSLIINYLNYRLRTDRDLSLGLYFVPTEGDWRPILGWMLKNYPDYFNPPNPKTWEMQGGNIYFRGVEKLNEQDLKKRAEDYKKFFGMGKNILLSPPEFGVHWVDEELLKLAEGIGSENISRLKKWHQENIDLVKNLASLGVPSLLFLHTTEFSTSLLKGNLKERFESSLVRQNSGETFSTWPGAITMNSDPAFAWGGYVLNQAKSFLVNVPEAAGIYWDRVDHRIFDFAHDDGISMKDGEPCYMLGFAIQKNLEHLSRIVHQQDKVLWLDAPPCIEHTKGADGFFGINWESGFQYLGIARPVDFLRGDYYSNSTLSNVWRDAGEIEECLQICLKWGLFPHLGRSNPIEERSYEEKYLHSHYIPLLKYLKKRKWVLSANPLELPETVEGNLFQIENSYAVTIVSIEKSILNLSQFVPIRIKVRLKDAQEIKKVYALFADLFVLKELSFEKSEDEIVINCPHNAGTLLLLAKENFVLPFDVFLEEQMKSFFPLRISSDKEKEIPSGKPTGMFSCQFSDNKLQVILNAGFIPKTLWKITIVPYMDGWAFTPESQSFTFPPPQRVFEFSALRINPLEKSSRPFIFVYIDKIGVGRSAISGVHNFPIGSMRLASYCYGYQSEYNYQKRRAEIERTMEDNRGILIEAENYKYSTKELITRKGWLDKNVSGLSICGYVKSDDYAEYEFEVKKEGIYYLLMKATFREGEEYEVFVDGKSLGMVTGEPDAYFDWGKAPDLIKLDSGKHTLKIFWRKVIGGMDDVDQIYLIRSYS